MWGETEVGLKEWQHVYMHREKNIWEKTEEIILLRLRLEEARRHEYADSAASMYSPSFINTWASEEFRECLIVLNTRFLKAGCPSGIWAEAVPFGLS